MLEIYFCAGAGCLTKGIVCVYMILYAFGCFNMFVYVFIEDQEKRLGTAFISMGPSLKIWVDGIPGLRGM